MPFDISDLKEHNSEMLKLLTSNLPDMLWVKDINGIYMYANQAICDGLLMAKDTEEPLGKGDLFFALREREKYKDFPNWHTFGELCFNSDKMVIENNKPMKFEEYGNIKGEMVYLEVYKAPFYNKEGEIIGTVGAGRDITELKKIQLDLEEKNTILAEQRKQIESFNTQLEQRVEEETRKRQNQEAIMIHQSRQAGMGELLESIAHQWRQPLNIIGIATANLETLNNLGALDSEDFRKKMEIISSNIHYMSDTIDDFRNFLNPCRVTTSFSLKSCIEQTVSIFHAQTNIQNIVESIHADHHLIVGGVENEFKQVLFILLNNAIDAIKAEMEKKHITKGEITLLLFREGSKAIVQIRDNGGGIKAEIINSIFNAYFSTKSNAMGTGIGLYIAKNIIENRMKGLIGVENFENGSIFTIELPLLELDN
ncbi:PAS domain-containing sensor histidine kinase [bacterium]|nr:PAS domain-containing sensor histidine kinase [bacterium]MBU1990660.1 PAS domain-containing sensor histidine kinase [bacterium]